MKRKILGAVLGVFLLLAYLLRVQAVNRQNDKTEIHYVSDSEKVKTQNLEIFVGDEILYEAPAFLARFSSVEEYYILLKGMAGSQDFLLGGKYILCVRVNVKNCSEEMQIIDHIAFHANVGVSYHTEVSPVLFAAVNGFGELGLRPGHNYSFWMPYILYEESFRKDRYSNLLSQDFSILCSGYPNIQQIRLSRLVLRKAEPEQEREYNRIVGIETGTEEETPLEDTPNGTLIKKGGEYIQNGVKFTVDSCRITKDLIAEMRKYDGWDGITPDKELKLLLEKKEVDEQGRLLPIGYMAVFVTLHVQNLSGHSQSMLLSPTLYNYTGKSTSSNCEVSSGDGMERSGNSYMYNVEKGTDTTATFLYVLYDTDDSDEQQAEKFKWHLQENPLYLNFDYGGNSRINIVKGTYANGKLLQVQ